MGNFAKAVIMLVKGVALILLFCIMAIIFGKPLVSVLDRVVLSRPLNFTIETGNMWLTDSTVTINDFPRLDSIVVDPNGRSSLIIKGINFPLGSSLNNPDSMDLYERNIFLIPDKGDLVQIQYRHSYFGWLTPFEWSLFLHLPDGRRNSYYTLTWTKADDHQFTARWRFEEARFGRRWSGWRLSKIYEDESALLDVSITDTKSN